MVTLYSTKTCPKCRVLGIKMDSKGIQYEKNEDVEVMQKKGLLTVPWLEVDGKMMDFNEANEWINQQ